MAVLPGLARQASDPGHAGELRRATQISDFIGSKAETVGVVDNLYYDNLAVMAQLGLVPEGATA